MALIGNEIEYAKKILTGAVKEKNLFKALVILTKYYYFELGMNDKEIEKNLRIYIKAMDGSVDDETIKNIIKSNTSGKTNINKLDHIIITVQEWQTIQEMGRTERERKLLFTLLCMYKVKIGLGYSDNGLVKIEYTKLNSLAHVVFKSAERIDVFRYLIECGMIEMGMGQLASRVKLHYVFPDSKQLIKITDFEAFNVYYDYLKKGGRLINCQECGKLMLDKSKTKPTKYCKDCANKKEQERAKEGMRKHRATK